MQDIVNEISKFNTLTETLVRMTYLKTVYSCPTQAERECADYDYDDEHHHHYGTTKHIVILSVYGEAGGFNMLWRDSTIDGDISRAKIHLRTLNTITGHIETSGFYQEHFNDAVYDDNHYQMTILSVEKLN